MESRTASEAMVMQQAYNRMLRDQMNMAVNPAMNAAQNSILGGIGSPLGSQAVIYGERRIESVFDINRQMNISVVSADNGYILVTKPDNGSVGRVLVANTIEELRDLITSEMVTRKMQTEK